jgi:lysophospholipase L1-like esterase
MSEAPKSRRRTSRIARFIVVIVALLIPFVLVLLGEFGVRLALPYINPLRIFTKPATDTMALEGAAPALEYDSELTYRIKPHMKDMAWAFSVFDTNAQGMRRKSDVGPKEPGAIRIACLGDSCTIGFGVPLASTVREVQENAGKDRPYVDLLEESLSAAFPGRKIEVLNMAVPGYSTWQGRVLVDRMGSDIDIVTAAFFTNDAVNRGLTFRQTAPATTAQRFVRRLAGRSQLLLHILRQQSRNPDAPHLPGIDSPATPVEHYVKNYDYMRRVCDEKGMRFVIINPFFRDSEDGEPSFPGRRVRQFRAAITAYAKAEGVPFADVPEVTDAAYPQNNDLFLERIHPNGQGHAVIAKRLHSFLVPLIEERIARQK